MKYQFAEDCQVNICSVLPEVCLCVCISLQKFIKDPYTTTMGSFSKVTNFFRDVLMTPENNMARLQSEVAEVLQDDIPGMEISQMDEPGFEVVTKVWL